MSLRASTEVESLLPSDHHRAALRSLAGSSASTALMFVVLGTVFVTNRSPWYFASGTATAFLLLLALEYLKGLRQAQPGA